MSGKLTSWIKRILPNINPKYVDYMSLNRLRLNLSADSSLPVHSPLTQKTRERAKSLQKIFEDTSISFESPEIVLNPYGLTPLTALVFFHTRKPCCVISTVKGHNAASDWQLSYDTPATAHAVPVFGLYPDSDNRIELRIKAPDGSESESREFHIKTDKLPPDHFLTKHTAYPAIPDSNGDIRYVLNIPSSTDAGGILSLANNRFLVPDHEICTPTNEIPLSTHLYEVDLLGRVFRTYYIGTGIKSILGESTTADSFFVLTKKKKLKNASPQEANSDSNAEKNGEDTVIEVNRETGEAVSSGLMQYQEPVAADFRFGIPVNSTHMQAFQNQMTGGALMDELGAVSFAITGWLREPNLYKGASIQTAAAVDEQYMSENYNMSFSICGDTLLIQTTGNDIQEVVFSKSDRIYQLDLTAPLLTSPETRYRLAVPFTEMYSGTYSIVIRFRDGGQEVLADTITLSRTRK